MISEAGFKSGLEQLSSLLAEVFGDEPFYIFCGWSEEGKFGWHYIGDDYPSFIVHFMGASFDEALKYATDLLQEDEDDYAGEDDWIGALIDEGDDG